MTCDKCRWWLRDTLTVNFGECRRLPPAFHPSALVSKEERQGGHWPWVAGDGWCGEFQKMRE